MLTIKWDKEKGCLNAEWKDMKVDQIGIFGVATNKDTMTEFNIIQMNYDFRVITEKHYVNGNKNDTILIDYLKQGEPIVIEPKDFKKEFINHNPNQGYVTINH